MNVNTHLEVENRRVRFEFDLYSKITLLLGDSATGKSTLISLVEAYCNYGPQSGVRLYCDRPCYVINNANWKAVIGTVHNSIVFADAGTTVITSVEFAQAALKTDNCYVLVSRDNLPLLLSADLDVCGIRRIESGTDANQAMHVFYPVPVEDGIQLPDKDDEAIRPLSESELIEMIDEGLAQADCGRTYTLEEVMELIDREFFPGESGEGTGESIPQRKS